MSAVATVFLAVGVDGVNGLLSTSLLGASFGNDVDGVSG